MELWKPWGKGPPYLCDYSLPLDMPQVLSGPLVSVLETGLGQSGLKTRKGLGFLYWVSWEGFGVIGGPGGFKPCKTCFLELELHAQAHIA